MPIADWQRKTKRSVSRNDDFAECQPGPSCPLCEPLRPPALSSKEGEGPQPAVRKIGRKVVMARFVLVHGAWHGSWCWKRVRKALQAQGHEVFTPTLTGVAERSHLLSRAVDLETHIQDVLNLLRWEELTDIVLCGHS